MKLRTMLALSFLAGMTGVVSAQTSNATAKRLITFADLQAMKALSDPQVSPSGKWVLFSVTDVSLEKNTKTNHLWVMPIAGGKEMQLTRGDGEANGRFSPDGKSVMYSSAQSGSGQIWVAPWDDAAGTMAAGRQVTNLETEADGAIWAPDSEHFLFASNVYTECESQATGAHRFAEEAQCNAEKDAAAAKNPVKALIFDHLLYRHWSAYQGSKHSHIFYASTAGGAPEDLTPASVIGDHEAPTFSFGGPLGYAISPDGEEIAYVVNLDKVPAASTNTDIYVLKVDSEPKTAKKVSTSPGSDGGPLYSPDGKWLAWRSQARSGFDSDKFGLVAMNRASHEIKKLIPKWDNWVDEFIWSPDSKTIYFASGVRDGEPIYATDIEGTSSDAVAGTVQSGRFGSLAVSPNGEALVASVTSVQTPPAIVTIQTHTPSGAVSVLSHLNDSLLAELQFSPLESFWFPGANDTEVEGLMMRPPNFDPTKKYPLKVLMHGGPQAAWADAWGYRWNTEFFASTGYVVVMINPRGSTGYGQKFVDEVSGDWGGKEFVDEMKGIDYVEQKYPFIDKTRECALGGGFIVNWVLTHTDRFKCIVTHGGMYNPQSAYGTTEELWFNEWEFRPTAADGMVEQTKPVHPWDYFDKTNDQDPFRKWSPMLYIKDAHTPTLVIHDQLDYRLDVSESFQLFTALQGLGVPSRMLYFPDEGHWVLKPQNLKLWVETINDWCDRWTGMNKYAAVGPEKNPVAVKK